VTDAALRRIWIDSGRATRPCGDFPGSGERRLDVLVWVPRGEGPFPLLVYCHGTNGMAGESLYLVQALHKAGYMVAAPEFPLTSRAAHTGIAAADVTDAPEQVRDISFVIDSVLADDELGPIIDANRIALAGHSLGGVTTYFATWGMQCRDPRIRAAIPIAASDPVASALANGLGFAGIQHAPVPVPALFLSAEKDLFARMAGRPGAAFARVEPPKHHLMIARGTHVWFHDGDDQPEDNRNPDCLWFDEHLPGLPVPGCEERVPLIGAALQQEIAAGSVVDFLDAYLKADAGALARLLAIGERHGAANIESTLS
jgi:predicted dienelactone hydrolase